MSKRIILSILWLFACHIGFSQNYSVTSKKAIKQFEKAQLHLAQKEPGEAISVLEKTVRKYPDFIEA